MSRGISRTALRRYPLPFISLAGLISGSIIYAILGKPVFGEYVWYATLVAGGIPIIISTAGKIARGNLAVDVIALLAIVTAVIMDEAFAGVVIVLMQSGGEAIENYGMDRATGNLRKLLEKRPKVAHIIHDGTILDASAEEVAKGDRLLVKQGEMFPVDGSITAGSTEVDRSSITGESRLVGRGEGDEVLSGTVNVAFAVEMVARRTADQSEFSHIVEMVQRAQKERAPIQRIADRYGTWLIPITLITAFAGWLITGETVTILSVFVVATPCPLILATPVAMMGGLGKATKHGIIVKGGGAIEILGRADEVFFDKTGTLTRGVPEVSRIISLSDIGRDELLRLTGSVEQLSTHPVAVEITEMAKKRFGSLPLPANFVEIPGRGVMGNVDGIPVTVGTLSLCREAAVHDGGYDFQLLASQIEESGEMFSCITLEGRIAGVILFSDRIREGVPEMIRNLRDNGIGKTALLTGDNLSNAEKVATRAGVDEYLAELRPADKLDFITGEMKEGKTVVMVGDGINDAPALAAASVGIAMGVRGSDISSETSQVILTVDDVTRVTDAVIIGRRTLSIAKQSIMAGMLLSGIFMVAAALGYIAPAEGALIQEAIDAVAIMNSIRASL